MLRLFNRNGTMLINPIIVEELILISKVKSNNIYRFLEYGSHLRGYEALENIILMKSPIIDLTGTIYA